MSRFNEYFAPRLAVVEPVFLLSRPIILLQPRR
jgi:hypothetical protein